MFTGLRKKFAFLFLTNVIFVAIILTSTFYTATTQEQDGRVINLAGRQRMLTQKMTKEALALREGLLSSEPLAKTARLFDKTLSGLLEGSSELGIPATNSESIRRQLSKVRALWQEFNQRVEVLLANADAPESRPFQSALDFIMAKNVELLREMNAAVKMYEQESRAKVENLKRFQIACLFFTILLAVFFGGFITRRWIIEPLEQLKNATAEVINGNLDVRLKIASRDEIGELAGNFNTMVDCLSTSRRQVNEEKELLEKSQQDLQSEQAKSEKDRRYLADSVEQMLRAMEQFAGGDLTVQLPAPARAAGQNEAIVHLFNGFNQAVIKIRETMGLVFQAAEKTLAATATISSLSESVASGAQEQKAQAFDVAAATEEMASTIVENASNCARAAEKTTNSGNVAREGKEIVEQSVHKIEHIAEMVKKSARTVEKLGNSSGQIGEIVSVINEIAEQTNLLALNAAIEAARAGEQGKGFAVVADEVRNLAERTAQATAQISKMISAIQEETQAVVTVMRDGHHAVDEGIELSKKAGNSLEEIVSSVDEVIEMITMIATASEEQSATMQQIARSIETISTVSGKSAKGTTEIAHATEELNALAERLLGLLKHFQLAHPAEQDAPSPAEQYGFAQEKDADFREEGAVLQEA